LGTEQLARNDNRYQFVRIAPSLIIPVAWRKWGTDPQLAVAVLIGCLAAPVIARAQAAAPVPVTVHNFARAETDRYFLSLGMKDGVGVISHSRAVASVDEQDVVRMNRDTLYSSGVFDLDAGPVTITLPEPAKRFMSLLVISQDHYALDVVYAPGTFSYDRQKVGTRYVALVIRTFANADNPEDVRVANRLQDAIRVDQRARGVLEVANWDSVSLTKARDALAALGALGDFGNAFGTKAEVDPIDHLIGTAVGWGGTQLRAADYVGASPPMNDGKTAYRMTLKDVPVDGFWSISVYNAKGFFEKNALGAYSLNSVTAAPSPDGSFTIQFGACAKDTRNCLPIMPGWNYTVRLYRPRPEILNGKWRVPEPAPVQ
jgi:hypothetical protein